MSSGGARALPVGRDHCTARHVARHLVLDRRHDTTDTRVLTDRRRAPCAVRCPVRVATHQGRGSAMRCAPRRRATHVSHKRVSKSRAEATGPRRGGTLGPASARSSWCSLSLAGPGPGEASTWRRLAGGGGGRGGSDAIRDPIGSWLINFVIHLCHARRMRARGACRFSFCHLGVVLWCTVRKRGQPARCRATG